MKDTPTTRLATVLLAQDVGEWLTTRREQGRNWYQLAADLSEATKGQVSVSHEAVRQWLMDITPTQAQAPTKAAS